MSRYNGETKLVYDNSGKLALREIKSCYNENCMPGTKFYYSGIFLRSITSPLWGSVEYVLSGDKAVQRKINNGGVISEHDYEYDLGFASVVLPEDYGSIEYYFETEFPKDGLLKKTEILNNNSEIIQNSESSWQSEEISNGVYLLTLSSSQNNYLGSIGKTDYKYDEYGNVIEVYSHGDLAVEGDEIKITSEYSYDAANWIFSLINSKIYDSSNSKKTETLYRYDSKGNLIETEQEYEEGENPVSRLYYNSKGELIKTISPEGVTSQYYYDSYGNLIKEDYSLFANTYEYYGNGLLKKEKDVRGKGISYEYDIFGRVIKARGDDGSQAEYQYAADLKSMTIRTKINDSLTNIYTETYDGFGSVLIDNENGVKINYEYDSLGNLIRVSNPYTLYPEAYSSYEYYKEPLMRLKRSVYPDGVTDVSYYYGKDYDMTKDEAGYYWKNIYDYNGNLIKIQEDSKDGINFNVWEEYEYNVFGNLVETKNQFFTPMNKYDSLGRLIESNDIIVAYKYKYDKDSNLIERTDGKGQLTKYIYDSLGRLIKVDYPEAPISGQDVEFIYNKDLLVEEKNNKYSKLYYYDSSGRLIKEKLVVYETDFDIDYSYDSAGNLIKIKTPCDTFSYGYDDFGRINQETKNNVPTKYTYNSRGQVTDAVTSKLDLSFHDEYDVNGFAKKKQVRYKGYAETSNYLTDLKNNKIQIDGNLTTELDYMGRLKGINTENDSIGLNYDSLGRLKQIDDEIVRYDAKGRIINTGAVTKYDANNNIIEVSDEEGRVSGIYDYENRVYIIKDSYENTNFTYDSNGNVIVMKVNDNIKIYPTEECTLRLGKKIEKGMGLKTFLSNVNKWIGARIILTLTTRAISPLIDNSIKTSLSKAETDYNVVERWVKGETGYEYTIIPPIQIIPDSAFDDGWVLPGDSCSDVCESIGRNGGACAADSRCPLKIGNLGTDIETGEDMQLNICSSGQTCCCSSGMSSKCDSKDDAGYGSKACEMTAKEWCGSEKQVCVGVGEYGYSEDEVKRMHDELDISSLKGQSADLLMGQSVNVNQEVSLDSVNAIMTFKVTYNFQCCDIKTEECVPIETEEEYPSLLSYYRMGCKEKEVEYTTVCSSNPLITGSAVAITGMVGEETENGGGEVIEEEYTGYCECVGEDVGGYFDDGIQAGYPISCASCSVEEGSLEPGYACKKVDGFMGCTYWRIEDGGDGVCYDSSAGPHCESVQITVCVEVPVEGEGGTEDLLPDFPPKKPVIATKETIKNLDDEDDFIPDKVKKGAMEIMREHDFRKAMQKRNELYERNMERMAEGFKDFFIKDIPNLAKTAYILSNQFCREMFCEWDDSMHEEYVQRSIALSVEMARTNPDGTPVYVETLGEEALIFLRDSLDPYNVGRMAGGAVLGETVGLLGGYVRQASKSTSLIDDIARTADDVDDIRYDFHGQMDGSLREPTAPGPVKEITLSPEMAKKGFTLTPTKEGAILKSPSSGVSGKSVPKGMEKNIIDFRPGGGVTGRVKDWHTEVAPGEFTGGALGPLKGQVKVNLEDVSVVDLRAFGGTVDYPPAVPGYLPSRHLMSETMKGAIEAGRITNSEAGFLHAQLQDLKNPYRYGIDAAHPGKGTHFHVYPRGSSGFQVTVTGSPAVVPFKIKP